MAAKNDVINLIELCNQMLETLEEFGCEDVDNYREQLKEIVE